MKKPSQNPFGAHFPVFRSTSLDLSTFLCWIKPPNQVVKLLAWDLTRAKPKKTILEMGSYL